MWGTSYMQHCAKDQRPTNRTAGFEHHRVFTSDFNLMMCHDGIDMFNQGQMPNEVEFCILASHHQRYAQAARDYDTFAIYRPPPMPETFNKNATDSQRRMYDGYVRRLLTICPDNNWIIVPQTQYLKNIEPFRIDTGYPGTYDSTEKVRKGGSRNFARQGFVNVHHGIGIFAHDIQH